jgi:hypothetical protein
MRLGTVFRDSQGKRKIKSGVERRNCAGCAHLSSVDRNRNDVWGAPAERFQRHEELKESVRVIGDIDGVRRILLDKGHVDGEQHLIALQLLCHLSLC